MKKESAQETSGNGQRSEPGSPAFLCASSGLDIACNRRRAKAGPDHRGASIGGERLPDPREVPFLIEKSDPVTNADQRADVVEEVYEEKREDEWERYVPVLDEILEVEREEGGLERRGSRNELRRHLGDLPNAA